MIKIFVANKNGKIELSQEELEALLKEAYEDGHKDGISIGKLMAPSYTPTITNIPHIDPYYTTTTSTPKPDNPVIITANSSNDNCEYINNIGGDFLND